MSGKSEKMLALAEKVFSGDLIVVCPSIGEYPVYNDLTYSFMRQDEARMKAYDNAIKKAVRGKKVVEIGTGDQAPLSQMCVEAGAEKVYAIEVNEATALKATQYVKERGMDHIIEIIHADATRVRLPEMVDVCVSEIIGNIGGSEGAASILANAKRFLKPYGKMIPDRCVTLIAPATTPSDIYENELIEHVRSQFCESIYQAVGERFQITRYVYCNFPKENLLCEPLHFEDDDFNSNLIINFESELRFFIEKDGFFDGLLLWIQLFVDSDNVINSLIESHWGPVFFRCDCFSIKAGDFIIVHSERKVSKNKINPDYFFKISVERNRETVYNCSINSYYSTSAG